MPLFKIVREQQFVLGLWKIEESEEEVSQLLTFDYTEQLQKITSGTKRIQSLTSRLLIKSLLKEFGSSEKMVINDANGRPYFEDSNISLSISHSREYAAAIIGLGKVGIDIEKIQAKLHAVKNKFLSDHELFDWDKGLNQLCIAWCVKEVVVKVSDQKPLSMKHGICLEKGIPDHECIASIMVDQVKRFFIIKYIRIGDYYLAYHQSL